MCTYLDQVGSTYYFRRPVPLDLQPFILTKTGRPRTEFKISLRTKDREAAKRLLPDQVKMSDREFDAARQKHTAGVISASTPVPVDPFADMSLDEFEGWQQQNREQLQAAIAEDDRMEEAEAYAAGLPADHPAALLLKEAREGRDRYQDRYRKRKRRDQQQEAAPALAAPQSSLAEQSPPVSLTGLFDDYAKVRNLTPAIAKEWRSGIDRFVAFIGHEDARRVTQADVLRWRNHARDEPQRNGKPRSPQRINAGYLAPLRGAFKHGISEMLIEHNPAAAVPKLHVPKVVETRVRMFTQEERKTILSAALTAEADATSRYRGLARRWVPWLCAYSGARVNEMTQLRAEDVQQIEGHWVIQITPDAGRVKGKTFRNVPIHEHLIEQGFLEMVKAQGPGPLFYDPEKGEADSERGQYKKAGERLAAWVRSIGVTDPGIMPNHAWRHTFKSLAMDAGIDERTSDYITGHASVGVGRRVYTHHSYGPLAEQMAKFPHYEIG